MGIAYNPKIVTDGLVLCLDAGNKKSFDPRENLYPHGETLQTLSNTRCTRQSFSSGGPFGTGYQEFTVTENSTSNIYNFDFGNTITLTAGQVITFSAYFKNISLSGNVYLRCWTGTGRAWTTQRQVSYNLTNETSTPSTGTILKHSISNAGGGWYRLSMTIQADVNGFSAISINVGGAVGEKYQATAVQVSNGLTLTEYLQTTGTAILRSTTYNDLSGNSYNLTIYGTPTHDPSGYFTLANNQTTQYMMKNVFANPTTAVTYSCWFRSNFSNANQTPFTYSVNGNNEMLFFTNSSTQIAPHDKGSAFGVNVPDMQNKWCNFVWTRNSASGVSVYYMDGVQVGARTYLAGTNITTGGYLIIGQESDSAGGGFDANQNLDGDFARLDVYDKVLTEFEVQQNFNALRGRFGL